MSPIAPDREIYIANSQLPELRAWLEQRLGLPLLSKPAGKRQWRLQFSYEGHTLPVLLIEEASPGFSSLWIDSPHSPWADDQALAREAWAHFGQEVRAIAGSWQEDADPDEWWRINAEGEGRLHWGP